MYTHVAAFTRQMRYVARHYHPVALPDLVDTLRSGAAIRPGSVAITLDDGYQAQVSEALPILRALGLPATLAVVAGTLEARSHVATAGARTAPEAGEETNHAGPTPVEWQGARFAGAEQLRVVCAEGVRLAGHSVTHRDLTACPPATLRAELVGARDAVRALGDAGDLFCYPGGMHNAVVRAAVADTGYRAALSCEPGANDARTDPLALRRVLVGASPDHFVAAQLAGLLDGPTWLYHRINRVRLWWVRQHATRAAARRAKRAAGAPCRCAAPPPPIEPALPRHEWPRVTIVIPTYNERATIDRCLRSIVTQEYPRDCIEILVIDGCSTDDTVARAQRYPGVRVLPNPARDAERAKELGLAAARGALFMYLDADADFPSTRWLQTLIAPLRDDPTLVASVTRFVARPGASAIERYLNNHPLQLGPLLRELCVDLAETRWAERATHTVCCFGDGRVPPIGLCLYRIEPLRAVIATMPGWIDVAPAVLLAQAGLAHVAYVPHAGIYHGRGVTLRTHIRQQRRNVTQVYFPTVDTRPFRYVEFSSPEAVGRLLWWVLRVNLLVPPLLTALRESWRRRDAACLYGFPLTVLETDAIAIEFLRSARGRALLRQGLVASARALSVNPRRTARAHDGPMEYRP